MIRVLIGKKLSGRYKLLEIIGGGGMANVYLARDMILERNVAIKILRLDFVHDEEFIKRFHREAYSATSLNHPNIVNIYDVGEEDDIYYIVMEYVSGQTLKQYIQKNAPLSVEKTLAIMEQLTSAIAHAHQNRIIHRDIKPQNILIDQNGIVKITDFGIAMALSSTTITHTNSVLGSVHYLSPEQARGGIVTEKSDIYSLGIVMFELLTGRLPFSGDSAVSIALKHLQSNTPSPRRWNPEIPQSVENIILKSTAKDAFYRYQSAEEMEEDLETSLNPERINEKKFTIPEDNDEITKAIPIIREEKPIHHFEQKIDSDSSSQDKNKTKTANKPKKRRNKLAIILISVFLLLIAGGIGFVTIFPSLFVPDDITVPDVSNQPYDEAVQKLNELGFDIGNTIETPDDEIPEGYVIKTDPASGHTVKEGTVIEIYISTGKEKVPFGYFIGKDYESVVELLKEQHYKIGTPEEVYDSSTPGTILNQYPKANESVIPDETEVTFTISKGPQKIILKDLTKSSLESVQDYIDNQGLNLTVKEINSDEIEKGLVVSQDPAPNSKLQKGDNVTVYISKGKEEKPPKKVMRTIDIPYNEEEQQGKEVEVKIYIEDANHKMDKPETFMITKPTQILLEFTIPHDKYALYKVVVNNSVIDQDMIPYPE